MPNYLWDNDGNEAPHWEKVKNAAEKIEDKREGDRGLNSNLEE